MRIIALLLCLFATAAQAQTKQDRWSKPQPVARHRHVHHAIETRIKVVKVRDESIERELKSELVALRRELDEFKTLLGPHQYTPVRLQPTSAPVARIIVPTEPILASLPDLRQPDQAPAIPIPTFDDDRIVADSLRYLASTATAGYTMTRQGVEKALMRLHPDMAIKLAEAIRRARAAGLSHAGVYSAYRPPSFGVGGFGNKYRSLHSYGLAVDMAGIGGPGSAAARLWKHMVDAVGLFLPYGPNHRAEWNHTQLIAAKVAPPRLKTTITASAPKDLRAMWLASGVRAHIPDQVSTAKLLPQVDWSR